MNKRQRAKSRRIKKLQRKMPGISYKEAKRLDRKMKRGANRVAAQVVRIGIGLRSFAFQISAIAESFALLRTNYVLVDEVHAYRERVSSQ